MSAAVAIDVHGLTKRYGQRTVVQSVDLQVMRGTIYGFLGPNGSGKTTTIRMLCGLLTPDGGEGQCLGFDLRTQARSIKREVGYMPQRFGLYEDLSIEENLDFIAAIYRVPERRDRVNAALDQLGLRGRRKQLAGTLSGGWKQRLALAACLLHQPQLLLLDEPTAGVDPAARRMFWDHLHTLAAGGMTVLVSTHYMDEAERCHALAFISRGRLLAKGSADELVAHATLAVREAAGFAEGLSTLAHELRHVPGLRGAAAYGAALRIIASSDEQLDAALAQARPLIERYRIRIGPARPSLEDVFIALTEDAERGQQEES